MISKWHQGAKDSGEALNFAEENVDVQQDVRKAELELRADY